MPADSSPLSLNFTSEELRQATLKLRTEFDQCLQRSKHEGVIDVMSLIDLLSRQITLAELVAVQNQRVVTHRINEFAATYEELTNNHERTIQVLNYVVTSLEQAKTPEEQTDETVRRVAELVNVSPSLITEIDKLQSLHQLTTRRQRRQHLFLSALSMLMTIYGLILVFILLRLY